MRQNTIKTTGFVVALGLLALGRGAPGQDKDKELPPPVPVHAMPDLPPLPDPVVPAAPKAASAPMVPAAAVTGDKRDTPGALPGPAVVDAPPVPAAPAAPPAPVSGFATMPRSSDPPPGRPPAFRLLVPAQHTEPTPAPQAAPAAPPPVVGSPPVAGSPPTPAPPPTVPPERPVAAPVVVSGAQTPVLTLDKRGPAAARAGQPLAYEIVVRNAGTVAAGKVRVEDELPAGTRFLSAEPTAAVQPDRLAWVLDSLPPGAEQRFKVTVQPSGDGDWTGAASVTVSAVSSLRTRVVRPEIAITLTGPATAAVGQPVVFQLRVTNHSGLPLSGLVLRDKLPAGLKHAAGTELEADLGVLEPGKTKDVTLSTMAVQPGFHVNEATITTTDGQQASARTTVNILPAPVTSRK